MNDKSKNMRKFNKKDLWVFVCCALPAYFYVWHLIVDFRPFNSGSFYV